ncbi:MAG: hypothetical protein AB1499_02845 [Nitrospirota bacterium]
MATLTKKEILAQLRRIGINTLNELESYLDEYTEYCNECSGHSLSGN